MFSARIGFFQGATAAAPQDIAFTLGATPYIASYKWTDATGTGTLYSNPATLATGNGRGIEFKTDNTVVFMSHQTAPYISAWAYTVGTGFGTKYSNPGTTGGSNPEQIAWNNTTSSIASSDSATPYINAWPWSSGFGTKYSNPATSIGGAVDDVMFSRAGNVIFTGPAVTPFIVAYAWSSGGFGTRFSSPATLPNGEAQSIDVSYTDNFVVYGSDSGQMRTYIWNNTTGWGSPITTIPLGNTDTVDGIQINSTGTTVFLVQSSSLPKAYAIDSAGNLGSLTSTASGTLSTNRGLGTNFKTGSAIAIANQGTPTMQAWPFSGTTFGTAYSTPTITAGGRDITFTN